MSLDTENRNENPENNTTETTAEATADNSAEFLEGNTTETTTEAAADNSAEFLEGNTTETTAEVITDNSAESSEENMTETEAEITTENSAEFSEEKSTAKERKKRPAKRKKRKMKKRSAKKSVAGLLLKMAALFLAAAVIATGLVYVLVLRDQGKEEAVQETTESLTKPLIKEPEEEKEVIGELGKSIIEHIITAGNAVDKEYKKRPPSYDLSEVESASFMKVSSLIDGSTGKVEVTAEGEGLLRSDDKYYYLFALNTYDTEIAEGSEYLDKTYKDTSFTMRTPLNYNRSDSKLFKKFAIAIKKDGQYRLVGTPGYITNPEVIAKYSSVYQHPASKKGLLVDPNRLRGNELDDLGVKQAAYNIPLARLLGPTTSSAHPTMQYTYNGRTYTINGQVVAEYDIVFGTLTAKGITTTAILLNNYSSSYLQLIHPKARVGGAAPYYMFNGAEESGVECMAAMATFLAERYSGNGHGRISNWVIANEINARKEWNYIEKLDTASYVEEYAKAFRVFYTAIKSVSSSARVYMPLDQQWDRNLKNNPDYDGRDILDEFNRNIKRKGDIDWGLAQHPYNVPLTETRIWKASRLVSHNAGTSMITMANIEVLTNYMQQEQFRNKNGEVRSILLSEQGYSSNAGEAVQAAAFAYAYYKVEHNPYIDGFLLNRETDAPEEVAQGLAFGLCNSGGGHKQIYNVFKYIDTADHAAYTEFAKGIIGISSWSEILK